VSSATYVHSLGCAVALGYVTAPEPGTPPSWYTAGEYEIEIAGQRVPADASLRPRYDPASHRPRS
jgi:glycine cleavage system aminomethyltransferase T